MSGEYLNIEGPDGAFAAYVSRPVGEGPFPAVVVLQEIFGINAVMRTYADDLAAEGYIAIAPDLFWRIQPGIQLTDKTDEEWQQAFAYRKAFDEDAGVKDINTTISFIKNNPTCSGKVGTVGYCLGGRLAFLAAMKTKAKASVGYYGVGLDNLLGDIDQLNGRLMLHLAGDDHFSTPEALKKITDTLCDHPFVSLNIYPGVDHAFSRPGGKNFNAEATELARTRTLNFLKRYLG